MPVTVGHPTLGSSQMCSELFCVGEQLQEVPGRSPFHQRNFLGHGKEATLNHRVGCTDVDECLLCLNIVQIHFALRIIQVAVVFPDQLVGSDHLKRQTQTAMSCGTVSTFTSKSMIYTPHCCREGERVLPLSCHVAPKQSHIYRKS